MAHADVGVRALDGLIFHVLLNMYTLWIFGQLLERLLGRLRFLTLYLLSGLAGSVGVLGSVSRVPASSAHPAPSSD